MLTTARAGRGASGAASPRRPARTCVLAGAPGSGVELLASAMAAVPALGRPQALFDPEAVTARAAGWGVTTGPDLVARYVPAALAAGAAGGDVASVIVHWSHWSWLLHALRTLPPSDPPATDPALVAAWLPHPTFVHVRRRDTARQALAWWRAVHARPAVTDPGATTGAGHPDPAEVRLLEGLAAAHDRRWEQYFRLASAVPLTVHAEDLVTGASRAVARVAAVNGVRLPGGPPAVDRPAPAGDELDDRWLAEYAALRDGLPAALGPAGGVG